MICSALFSFPYTALADLGKKVMQAMNGNNFSYERRGSDWFLLYLIPGGSGPVVSQKL